MSSNSSTYVKILSKGLEANLPGIEDGKLRFTTDTGRLFLDSGENRVEISDFVKGKTAQEIIQIEHPLPKFYLASDTDILYYFNNNTDQWNTVKVDIGLATTASEGLMPALEDDTSKFLRSDGTWAEAGNVKLEELEREDYDELSEDEKNNGTLYMVKDKAPDITDFPALIGEYYKIDNSKLNPNFDWGGIKFFFNSSDCAYCYPKYKNRGYDTNAGMHPYYDHGTSGDTRNVLITQNMPTDTHYVGVYHSIYGLQCTSMIFIPKDIIDNGQAAMFLQFFYTSVECTIQYCHIWNDWTDESKYVLQSATLQPGSHPLDWTEGSIIDSGNLTLSWFANYPIIGGEYLFAGDLTQEEIDTYLATKEDNYPRLFNVNYFTYDHIFKEYDGTVMLNSIDYTGRIDTSKYALKSELSGYASTADLSGKQDVLTAGSNITFNGSTISANNTTYGLATTSSIGLMPALNGSTAKYLRSDGTWEIPAGGGGGDTNYIELTQAEYNALTPEEKENGTLYFITDGSGGGGGGSTVIPNPIGEPAGTLNTIGIDNVIYDIPGSGGGGSSQTITDVLWSGSKTTSTWVSPIEIENLNIDKYDVLVVQANNGQHLILINQILEGDSEGSTTIGVGGYPVPNDSTRNWTIYINRTGTTLRIFTSTGQAINVTKILGVKFCGMLAPMIYSFEEREVGVWIDDKPLYQKTFDKRSLYLADSTWSNNILGTTGIQIVNYEGYFCLGADTEPSISYSYYRSSSEYFTATIDSSYSDIDVRPNMNYGAIYAGLITIWYTKDSDVAGSGKYGSLGVPMVHYDNTEKVVGTYFGKPLYEKSYENIAGTGTTVNVTLSDLSNIEYIFVVPEASASNVGNTSVPFPYLHPDANSNIIGYYFTISNGVPTMNIRRGSSSAIYALKYLTVRYTKTTD